MQPPTPPMTPPSQRRPEPMAIMSADTHAVIQLVGMPQPGVIDTSHSLGPGFASSSESANFNAIAFPALEPHEQATTKIIDTIDATNEDALTLDTFEQHIRSHTESGKDFILARVVTESEDGRLYYNYYAAHHINKVLFRTQPEEGLLHRMKAKNPLNNMLVVGDVHYFVIKANDPAVNPLVRQCNNKVNASSLENGLEINKSTKVVGEMKSNTLALHEHICSDSDVISLRSVQISLRPSSVSQEEKSGHVHLLHRRASMVAEGILPRKERQWLETEKCRLNLKSSDCLLCRLAQHVQKTMNMHPSNWNTTANSTVIDAPAISAAPVMEVKKPVEQQQQEGPMVFVAQYYATDDDFLMRRFVREYFKKNTVNPEDLFLFTLYGSSQMNGDATFSAPLVSDPTDPHARAETLEAAVATYLRRLNGSTQPTSETSQSTPGSRMHSRAGSRIFGHRQRQSISATIVRRFRSLLGERPVTPAPSEANLEPTEGLQTPTPTEQTPMVEAEGTMVELNNVTINSDEEQMRNIGTPTSSRRGSSLWDTIRSVFRLRPQPRGGIEGAESTDHLVIEMSTPETVVAPRTSSLQRTRAFERLTVLVAVVMIITFALLTVYLNNTAYALLVVVGIMVLYIFGGYLYLKFQRRMIN